MDGLAEQWPSRVHISTTIGKALVKFILEREKCSLVHSRLLGFGNDIAEAPATTPEALEELISQG